MSCFLCTLWKKQPCKNSIRCNTKAGVQVITHGCNFKFLGSLIALQNLPRGIKVGSDMDLLELSFL